MAVRRRKHATPKDRSTDPFDPALLDDERHHEALERLAVQAMSSGNFRDAFKYADRRCRVPPLAQAYHYVLRAEASYQMGERDAAIGDISRALELLPEDLAANRRMLAWAEGAGQRQAAQVLVRCEQDFKVLAKAVSLLRKGRKRGTFGAIRYTDTEIFGWASWPGRRLPKLRIEADSTVIETLTADPRHPLRTPGSHAATFSLSRPRSDAAQTVSLSVGRTTVCELRLPPNHRDDHLAGRIRRLNAYAQDGDARTKDRAARRSPEQDDPLTVIVPIYDDYEATRDCLESLLTAFRGQPHARAILVNDATPDPRIADLVRKLANNKSVRLIENERNLGFVRSVNLAFSKVAEGDVILLNADTIVPDGFMTRLRAAARASSDVGTVVPLSNNGEFTSFPTPNKPNPVRSPQDIHFLDATAADANRDKIIDIPNGTGFCLYITRECLDAAGPLSDAFERGYLEDADFCLRARELGFRNVCAPSVYVGHVGSRSFGAEKRALVMRNIGKLESRFSDYRAECAAFIKADPLKQSRAAIERLSPSLSAGAVLLVGGRLADGAIAEARAEQLANAGQKVLIVAGSAWSPNQPVTIAHPFEDIPQSLRFEIAKPEGRSALSEYVATLRPSRVEIAEPACAPDALLDLLLAAGAPIDILVSDGGLICPRGTCLDGNGEACEALQGAPCSRCLSTPGIATHPAWTNSWRSKWHDVVRRADHVYAPCPHARQFAMRFPHAANIVELDIRQTAQVEAIADPDRDAKTLGFLAVDADVHDHRTMGRVARALTRDRPGTEVVVIGHTLDDLDLMRLDRVFVTGRVEIRQLGRVLRQYGVKAVFAATRRPLFGHPMIAELAAAGFPLALFDWSLGKAPVHASNLAIDPSAPDEAVAAKLKRWFSRL
ncbi:MAG: glycosyltransferase [Xanthobacteraceae bacterium]|nr:glycosyltransferase [Xanthobacteraceae bacterium]